MGFTILAALPLAIVLSPHTSDLRPESVDLGVDLAELPSVFVYDLPPVLNSDLLSCYFSTYDAWPWDDSVPHGKDTVNASATKRATESAQYSVEMLLHAALLNHPRRTLDPTSADVLYVPFYSYLSSEKYMDLGNCSLAASSDVERAGLLSNALERSKLSCVSSSLETSTRTLKFVFLFG